MVSHEISIVLLVGTIFDVCGDGPLSIALFEQIVGNWICKHELGSDFTPGFGGLIAYNRT